MEERREVLARSEREFVPGMRTPPPGPLAACVDSRLTACYRSDDTNEPDEGWNPGRRGKRRVRPVALQSLYARQGGFVGSTR